MALVNDQRQIFAVSRFVDNTANQIYQHNFLTLPTGLESELEYSFIFYFNLSIQEVRTKCGNGFMEDIAS